MSDAYYTAKQNGDPLPTLPDPGEDGVELFGEADKDFVQGSLRADFLDGGAHADRLFGLAGNDSAIGIRIV